MNYFEGVKAADMKRHCRKLAQRQGFGISAKRCGGIFVAKIRKKEPKRRNRLVPLVMKKGVRKHKNRKREATLRGDKRLED